MELKGKKILIAVSGSIAAYKIPFLIREFKTNGAEVKIICTPSALEFVTPTTLSTLSKNPVYSKFSKSDTGEWVNHVELALWADCILLAPATASTISKLANGNSDNLLITTIMSARCPILIAPAMDHDMYLYQATQDNLNRLKGFGHIVIPPEDGELASGLIGYGRLSSLEVLYHSVLNALSQPKLFLNKKVVITAGPTQEAIDPVRFISNHSTGKMGLALARSFALQGAHVVFIHGPLKVSVNEMIAGLNIDLIEATDADSMAHVTINHFKKSDIGIMTAAVADYKPLKKESKKIKKSSPSFSLDLVKTIDIAQELGKIKKKNQILIGFALETTNELVNAKNKMVKKNLDMIVLNSLNNQGAGFGYDTNQVTIMSINKPDIQTELLKKYEIAQEITFHISNLKNRS